MRAISSGKTRMASTRKRGNKMVQAAEAGNTRRKEKNDASRNRRALVIASTVFSCREYIHQP